MANEPTSTPGTISQLQRTGYSMEINEKRVRVVFQSPRGDNISVDLRGVETREEFKVEAEKVFAHILENL